MNFTFIGTTLHPTILITTHNRFFLNTIAIIQNIILFLLGLPTRTAALQQPSALSTSDYVLATLAVIDLTCEFISDNQQWSFQNYKHSGKLNANEWPGANIAWTPEDAKRGFITRGLWAWSRHPNFFCEQSFWVCTALCVFRLFFLITPCLCRQLSPSSQSLPQNHPNSQQTRSPTPRLCGLSFLHSFSARSSTRPLTSLSRFRSPSTPKDTRHTSKGYRCSFRF